MKVRIVVPESRRLEIERGYGLAGLPAGTFPTEEELIEAIRLDELCREINRLHNEEVELFARCVECRLDRLERSAR